MNRFILCLAVICTYACGDESPASETNQRAADTSSAQPYFPVADFLKSEIRAVDSLPVGIMQYRSSATSSDSGYIQLNRFHELTEQFLPASLNDSAFQNDFQETSFLDKATGNATFFYTSRNPKQVLKRIDVITQRTDAYDRVKSLYLEKRYGQGDSAVTKKLYWIPGKNFQLITQVSRKAADAETELIKVVWDNSE